MTVLLNLYNNMEREDIKIKKAKLVGRNCLEATYFDSEGNEITIKGKNKCHKDLKDAFTRLVPFFTDLTEQKEADNIEWYNLESEHNANLLSKIEVTGVSFGTDLSNPFVTLTGNRTLLSSRVLNLNSPGIEMGSETLDWNHVDELDIALQDLKYEVKEYIINKKWEAVQLELEFERDPDDPFADTVPTDELPPIDENAA